MRQHVDAILVRKVGKLHLMLKLRSEVLFWKQILLQKILELFILKQYINAECSFVHGESWEQFTSLTLGLIDECVHNAHYIQTEDNILKRAPYLTKHYIKSLFIS